jgi:phospholipase/lecithinase/hemolysin
MNHSTRWLSTCLFSSLLLPALFLSQASAASFNEIVVFGDSLSDNGNLLFFEEQPTPDPALYFEGRFSNGPVWVEYLADPTRLSAPLTDIALGGAQTDGLVPPGLIEQVTTYIATNGPPLSSSSLFIIWIGGNDYFNGEGDALEAVTNIEEAMERLVQLGAKNLLILNLPDLGAVPDLLGTPEADEATAFSLNFNTALAGVLDRFESAYPAVTVYEFDVYSFSETVQNDPAAFGFINVGDQSPNFAIPNNFDGAGYVFWDDKHPTTSMHALIADQVTAAVNQQAPPPGPMNGGAAPDDSDSTCFVTTARR